MTEPEIVRPDALKRLMRNINGNTVEISSLELARLKLNWPRFGPHPPESLTKHCASELLVLYRNPPDGWDISEAPGKYFSLYLRREKNDID